jgi:hypothetical protein
VGFERWERSAFTDSTKRPYQHCRHTARHQSNRQLGGQNCHRPYRLDASSLGVLGLIVESGLPPLGPASGFASETVRTTSVVRPASDRRRAAEAKRAALFALHDSTGHCLSRKRGSVRWPVTCAAVAIASSPTDGGPAARFAGRVVRSIAVKVQNQAGVSPIMLLFPRLGCPDLGRIAYPTVDPQLFLRTTALILWPRSPPSLDLPPKP